MNRLTAYDFKIQQTAVSSNQNAYYASRIGIPKTMKGEKLRQLLQNITLCDELERELAATKNIFWHGYRS